MAILAVSIHHWRHGSRGRVCVFQEKMEEEEKKYHDSNIELSDKPDLERIGFRNGASIIATPILLGRIVFVMTWIGLNVNMTI